MCMEKMKLCERTRDPDRERLERLAKLKKDVNEIRAKANSEAIPKANAKDEL